MLISCSGGIIFIAISWLTWAALVVPSDLLSPRVSCWIVGISGSLLLVLWWRFFASHVLITISSPSENQWGQVGKNKGEYEKKNNNGSFLCFHRAFTNNTVLFSILI
jgi:hypothetical protein